MKNSFIKKPILLFALPAEDREYFYKNYKIPLEKSTVITYGISWNRFPPLRKDRSKKLFI